MKVRTRKIVLEMRENDPTLIVSVYAHVHASSTYLSKKDKRQAGQHNAKPLPNRVEFIDGEKLVYATIDTELAKQFWASIAEDVDSVD